MGSYQLKKPVKGKSTPA
jgi:hypothetical protein